MKPKYINIFEDITKDELVGLLNKYDIDYEVTDKKGGIFIADEELKLNTYNEKYIDKVILKYNEEYNCDSSIQFSRYVEGELDNIYEEENSMCEAA